LAFSQKKKLVEHLTISYASFSNNREEKMKKVYLSLLSLASLGFLSEASAETPPKAETSATIPLQSNTSNFTPAQLSEIEKTVGDYLTQHPDVVMTAFKAGMEKQQKEEVAKMEKAVSENKDKIFKDAATPVAGNSKGAQSVVVFMDPACGFCKKLHKELSALMSTNKDVKVIFKDLPIMGASSLMIIKAMLAAKEQGKYDQLQKVVFEADKPLTKKQLMKMAASVGIDTKKLEADMKNKTIQAQIDGVLELSKALGIHATPTLIVGETKVVPGYVTAEELNKLLKESSSPVS